MAILLQGVVGVALIEYSSWASPHEVSSVGTLGFAITPHPLAFGLYLLPFTAWGVYLVLKSCFKNYSYKNNSVKKMITMVNRIVLQ